MVDKLIINIGQLATSLGSKAQKGREMNEVFIRDNAAVGITDGKISYVGASKGAPEAKEYIDAENKLVTPGLVDGHTHLVFGGWRQNELTLKLNGASYLDILKAGGGILSTVRSTRAESKEELFKKAKNLSHDMLLHGTTTIEAKSGYGLNLKDEVKQLEVVKALNEQTELDFVPTFMGAHTVPEEYKGRPLEYIDFVCNDVMPVIKERNLAKYCDVFCETGVFDTTLSEKLLIRARSLGLGVKIHADEIDPIGGGELAGRIKADSAEHLIAATDEGIRLMAEGSVIGVLLPATSFYLDKPYARAQDMINAGMAIAAASDFNPGSSPSFNMQFVMNLCCLKYRLTPGEALCAVTLNAAAAIGLAANTGTVELGKNADILIWNAPDLNYVYYRYGNNQVDRVMKNGNVIS
jgi:imidazolonepropionase